MLQVRYINMIRTGLVTMLEFADEKPDYVAEIEYLPIPKLGGWLTGLMELYTFLHNLFRTKLK